MGVLYACTRLRHCKPAPIAALAGIALRMHAAGQAEGDAALRTALYCAAHVAHDLTVVRRMALQTAATQAESMTLSDLALVRQAFKYNRGRLQCTFVYTSLY